MVGPGYICQVVDYDQGKRLMAALKAEGERRGVPIEYEQRGEGVRGGVSRVAMTISWMQRAAIHRHASPVSFLRIFSIVCCTAGLRELICVAVPSLKRKSQY